MFRFALAQLPNSRRARFAATIACASLALAACVPAATFGDVSALVTQPTLLVVTTREPAGDARSKPWYGYGRAKPFNVARATLDPPGDRRLSLSGLRISEWKIATVEPVTTGHITPLLPQSGPPRDVLLYTHGFNTTFEQAALDAAFLSNDIRFAGDTMLFSWPSRAGTLGLFDYGYDHESAVWSRDAFEDVLDELAASRQVGRINIVAHSMGTMLVMEALRQRSAQGAAATNKIGAIVFASPDIDMDVFTSTVDRIGPLARRITVVTATDDRALKLSRQLYGGVTRVGGEETAQLRRIGIRVIDGSDRGSGISKHDAYLASDQIRRAIRRAIDNPESPGT
jgi:esterase/lipase superfamily enzyme